MKHTLYFKKEEQFETLNKGATYDPEAPLEHRKIIYQSTGSVYEG